MISECSGLVKRLVGFKLFRLDGTGYPIRLKTKPMNLFPKIIAVADVFHAMTSERAYRKKQSPFKVLEMIFHDDFGKFDIAVVKTLLSSFVNFSMGSQVKRTMDSSLKSFLLMLARKHDRS